MGTERKPWKISPGDPSRPGVTGRGNRYNFAVDTGSGEPLELLFYKNGSEEQRILLDETYRTAAGMRCWSKNRDCTSMSTGIGRERQHLPILQQDW